MSSESGKYGEKCTTKCITAKGRRICRLIDVVLVLSSGKDKLVCAYVCIGDSKVALSMARRHCLHREEIAILIEQW